MLYSFVDLLDFIFFFRPNSEISSWLRCFHSFLLLLYVDVYWISLVYMICSYLRCKRFWSSLESKLAIEPKECLLGQHNFLVIVFRNNFTKFSILALANFFWSTLLRYYCKDLATCNTRKTYDIRHNVPRYLDTPTCNYIQRGFQCSLKMSTWFFILSFSNLGNILNLSKFILEFLNCLKFCS